MDQPVVLEVGKVAQQPVSVVFSRNLLKRSLLAALFVALAGLAIAAFVIRAQPASAVDLTGENCSIKISMPSESQMLQADEADVVYDLYQIAAAVPNPGYDAYLFQPVKAMEDVSFDWGSLGSSDSYDSLAQVAAQRTPMGSAVGQLPAARTDVVAGVAATDLDPGLYLIIAHGAGLAPDRYTVRNDDGTLASLAVSPQYRFTFKPELIAVPSKEGVNGVPSTAGSGPWRYDVSATLKPGQDMRYGSLRIVKDLLSFESAHPADFVFRIDAYSDEVRTQLVYSDVVRLQFDSAGQKAHLLEGVIPAESYVVVTEVYSGSVYAVEGDGVQVVGLVKADPIGGISSDEAATAIASAEFANNYNAHNNQGGSIVNSFTYGTPQEKAAQGKIDLQWQWSKE